MTQYGHFPWKNYPCPFNSYHRYMYNKDASGDEACLMFSKGGWSWNIFCQLSWDQMFFQRRRIHGGLRAQLRPDNDAGIHNNHNHHHHRHHHHHHHHHHHKWSFHFFNQKIPKIFKNSKDPSMTHRIDRSDWKFYELCLEAMPMHYILSFLTFWICCRCCYVSQFSVVDVDRLFCISNLRWGKQTAAVPRVQQTQPVENAALWFALMSVY